MMPKILAFAGSTRRDSFNRRLLSAAISGAQTAGAEVTVLELRDYELPLFNQDAEEQQGIHPTAAKLKELMKAHAGFLIACPEYNGSITPLLKNTLDWCSRQAPGEAAYAPYRNKIVGLLAASAGKLGGLRGLRHVREILANLQCVVLPEQLALAAADKAFDDQGRLRDEKTRKQAEAIGLRVAAVLKSWV